MKRIIRVFPIKTSATPDDDLVRVNEPPGFFDEADEVHVSVTFSWDRKRADELAYQWKPVAPVKIGGPAIERTDEVFMPGQYVKHGYTITSRGCPNGCWFCCDRRTPIREFDEIPLGYNHLTSNLLACSQDYIRRVFDSCHEAKKVFRERIEFTGGLEAARLKEWHVEALREIRPKQMFFAYDTPDDLKPLQRAGEMLMDHGFTTAGHTLRAYVLVGYEGDTFEKAETRVQETIAAGFMPMAMAYRGPNDGKKAPGWGKWQRLRANATIIATEYDKFWKKEAAA